MPTTEISTEREPSLDELAAIANGAHEASCIAGASLIQHAIRAGEALEQVRLRLPHGEWTAWLVENFSGSHDSANLYRRIAFHRELIERAGPTSLVGAKNLISRTHSDEGLVLTINARETRRQRARDLRKTHTASEVAEIMGVSTAAVYQWTGDYAETNRRERARRRAALKAVRQREAEKGIRKVGGGLADAYALVRRAAKALEQASGEATDAEAKAAISDAMGSLYKSEDAIVRASRSSLGYSGITQHKGSRRRTQVAIK